MTIRELVGLIEEYISSQDDMEVVGIAHNGQECLRYVRRNRSRCLVLDIIMPHLGWSSCSGANFAI